MNSKKNQGGFGLVEVLITMSILAIGYTAINLMAYDNAKAMSHVSSRISALNLAHQVVDSLEMKGLGVLSDTASFARSVENKTFQVNYSIKNHVILTSPTDSSVINRKVNIRVSWTVGTEPGYIRLEELID